MVATAVYKVVIVIAEGLVARLKSAKLLLMGLIANLTELRQRITKVVGVINAQNYGRLVKRSF